ncbi:hypothetical protein M758_2G128500 [Ceratodon purpureus]|nr:hypothetical protein M758_2G128500 [Ceratodon purpureus]
MSTERSYAPVWLLCSAMCTVPMKHELLGGVGHDISFLVSLKSTTSEADNCQALLVKFRELAIRTVEACSEFPSEKLRCGFSDFHHFQRKVNPTRSFSNLR